ncbi:MAG TPA: hypothetical protein VE862_12005 [Candidatus Acidoferrum sp.]|nr:hypothetical protein [Candidatus Acidoferrum sp.]
MLLSTSFTLQAEDAGQCHSTGIPVTIDVGTQVFGTINSSGYVFFHILTDQQVTQSEGAPCKNVPAMGILVAGAITSYSLNWTSPSTGRYYFAFTNVESYDDSISITLWTQQ